MAGSFSVSGSFNNTFRFLRRMLNKEAYAALDQYGQEGVRALQAFTPKDSGETANSWSYEILDQADFRIVWSNSNVNDGFVVAVGLQFGHGTGWGGYVVGRDYINPALQPTFDKIAEKVWTAVTSA